MPFRFVVKNGMNRFARTSSVIPGPVSLTLTSTRARVCPGRPGASSTTVRAESVNVPPARSIA